MNDTVQVRAWIHVVRDTRRNDGQDVAGAVLDEEAGVPIGRATGRLRDSASY